MYKKHCIFFVILVVLQYTSVAQQQDTSALYLRFPTLPPFTIIKTPDSTKFTKADLSKRKATLIMIFSPDCDHCQHMVNELKDNMKLFKKIQIVMASPLEYSYIYTFYNEYKISTYSNIFMGKDAGYMLSTFYNAKTFPALFLYDKKGNFIQTFDSHTAVQKIAEAFE